MENEAVVDLLGIGFGPSRLALAVDETALRAPLPGRRIARLDGPVSGV